MVIVEIVNSSNWLFGRRFGETGRIESWKLQSVDKVWDFMMLKLAWILWSWNWPCWPGWCVSQLLFIICILCICWFFFPPLFSDFFLLSLICPCISRIHHVDNSISKSSFLLSSYVLHAFHLSMLLPSKNEVSLLLLTMRHYLFSRFNCQFGFNRHNLGPACLSLT